MGGLPGRIAKTRRRRLSRLPAGQLRRHRRAGSSRRRAVRLRPRSVSLSVSHRRRPSIPRAARHLDGSQANRRIGSRRTGRRHRSTESDESHLDRGSTCATGSGSECFRSLQHVGPPIQVCGGQPRTRPVEYDRARARSLERDLRPARVSRTTFSVEAIMPLDPQAQSLVDAMAKLNLKPIEDSTPEEARESMLSRTAALGPFPDVAAVTDRRVPVQGAEITVRLYAPAGAGPHPALVFYHGGGWVIGDLDTHDGLCRTLTNAAGCIVASVDYRLAPETKYPAAAEDSYAALVWLAANAARLGIDPRRIAVGGDSAGGNLSRSEEHT